MKTLLRFLGTLVVLLQLAEPVFAQQNNILIQNATVSTSGSACSPSTNCAVVTDLRDVHSFSVDLDVGTSGTFEFEATINNTTWRRVTSISGDSSASADGAFYFVNPGWRQFRVRASANVGPATVNIVRGQVTSNAATVSGSVTISGTADVNITGISGATPLASYTNATLQAAAVANGNGTTLSVRGYASAVLTVNCSTCSGGSLVNFEGTEDGTNYTAIVGRILGTQTYATTTSTAGLTYWTVNTFGFQAIRARISAYSAGTITVTATAILSGDNGVVAAAVSDGTNVQRVDPCQNAAYTKTQYSVSLSANGFTEIANAVAGQFWYICAVAVNTTASQHFAILTDDTDGCGSPNEGVSTGGTTAATGWHFAANGGISFGNGGYWVMKSNTANRYLCIDVDDAAQISGVIIYVSAP